MSRIRRIASLAAVLTAAAATVPVLAAPATTAGRWAPAASASIHPGVIVSIARVECAAGFVLAQRHQVYVAVPASCSGVSGGNPTDGCSEAQVPLGFNKVQIDGARHYGTLVYSSFVRMESTDRGGPNMCANNSLSLVQLDRRDIPRTNPSIPVAGGPTGVSTAQPAMPDQLLVLLDGAPANAQATTTTAGGWAHGMYVDGEVNNLSVGSPALDSDGKALGMVSYVPAQGGPGETTVTDLGRELRALRHTPGFHHVHLVTGTQDYAPPGLLAG